MKIASIVLAIATLVTSTAFAQANSTSNPYALKMATEGVDAFFPSIKPMMDIAYEKMEQDASKPTFPPSAKIFAQEFRNSLNRENLIAILSKSIQEYFDDDDFREMQKYHESKVGLKAAKYQATADPKKLISPLIAEACDRTLQRLNAIHQPIDDAFRKACNK